MTDISKELDLVEKGQSGTVKWFHVRDGVGFLLCPDYDDDIFVHYTDIIVENDAFKVLYPAQNVTFDVYRNSKGLQALNIALKH